MITLKERCLGLQTAKFSVRCQKHFSFLKIHNCYTFDMDKNPFLIFLFMIAIIAGIYFYNSFNKPVLIPHKIIEDYGVVTAYNTGCYVDAVCSVEIDGKYIIPVGMGRTIESEAPEFGLSTITDKDIGAKVKFRAIVSDPVTDKYLSIDQKGTYETFYILKIEDYFACSDNCPGEKEQYMKPIFTGIKEKTECEKYGGTYQEIIGWGVQKICIAE